MARRTGMMMDGTRVQEKERLMAHRVSMNYNNFVHLPLLIQHNLSTFLFCHHVPSLTQYALNDRSTCSPQRSARDSASGK